VISRRGRGVELTAHQIIRMMPVDHWTDAISIPSIGMAADTA
jgi:hypothetical protein